MEEALPDLPSQLSYRKRLTKAGAEGVLAKMHIFMGDHTTGLSYLNQCFQSLADTNIPVGLYDYGVTTQPGGIHRQSIPGLPQFAEFRYKPWPYQDKERVFTRAQVFLGNFDVLNGALALTPEITQLYGSNDYRLLFMANRIAGTTTPFKIKGLHRSTRFHNGISYDINFSDLHLLLVECKARTNDLAGAIQDLEYFRKHRMPEDEAAIPSGLSKDELIRVIIDERKREFAGSGYLWQTLRRLYYDPLFAGQTYEHILYDNDTGTIKEVYTLPEKRLVTRLPLNFINANPDMPTNE